MWGYDGHIKLAEHEDTLYFLLDYGKGPFMYAPLMRDLKGDYRKALRIAAEHFGKMGAAVRFKCISGILRQFFLAQGCHIHPDRNNYDYVYRTSDLLTLSGKRYHAKRNHINQFTSQFAWEYARVDSSMSDECLSVYNRWLENKGENMFGAREEMRAIKRLMLHMEALGVVGGGIRIGGRLEAFTLGECLNDVTALIHVEKAHADMPGLYAVINQAFLKHAFSGTQFVNREEDMGFAGLRQAKLSYHPICFVEEFSCNLI